MFVNADNQRQRDGVEETQTDALARGKYLAEELGLDGLFEYHATGSQWILDEYLQAHPEIRSDVIDRLSRVPDKTQDGLLARLRTLL